MAGGALAGLAHHANHSVLIGVASPLKFSLDIAVTLSSLAFGTTKTVLDWHSDIQDALAAMAGRERVRGMVTPGGTYAVPNCVPSNSAAGNQILKNKDLIT